MSTAPEPLYVETYGDRLHKAMKVAKLDAKTLGAKAGISRESIASYLHDRTVPSIPYNRALAWALATDPAHVVAVESFLLHGARPAPDDGGSSEPGYRGGSGPRRTDTRFCSASRANVVQLPARKVA